MPNADSSLAASSEWQSLLARVAVAFLVFLGSSYAIPQIIGADWKYYGSVEVEAVNTIVFYSASAIRRLPDGHVQVWTKGISETDMNLAGALEDKDAAERIAAKLKAGYTAPFLNATKGTKEDNAAAMLMEDIANEAHIQPKFRILYELDCRNQMIRELSMALFKDGKITSTDHALDWKHIAPETGGGFLMQVLCVPD